MIINYMINQQLIICYRDTAVKLSPYYLLNSENKPVVLEKLKQILVVYGEAESEQFRSQANNFSQVCYLHITVRMNTRRRSCVNVLYAAL